MHSVKWLLLLLAAFMPNYSVAKDFWQPPYFWREKPVVQKKMTEERFIPVSVQRQENVWSMKGAGRVQASTDFVYKLARDFNRLKKHSDHFKKVEWSEDKKELELVFRAVGRDMSFKYKMIEETDQGSQRKMIWQMTEGKYVGAQTALLVEDAGSQECEVMLISSYAGELSWMPDFMLSMGVEAVLHHVATALRLVAESEWTKWKETQNALRTSQ